MNDFVQSEAGQPPRPASALAAAMEFNVDSLFADTQAAHQGPLSQRAESTDGAQDSRFGRWFQLENSPSTAKSLPPQLEQQVPPPASRQHSGQPPTDLFQDNPQPPASEASQLQVLLTLIFTNHFLKLEKKLFRSFQIFMSSVRSVPQFCDFSCLNQLSVQQIFAVTFLIPEH